MLTIALIGVLASITALFISLYGVIKVLLHLTQTPPHLDAPFRLMPITILKPLKGLEEHSLENISSFFRIDYPNYEIIFSVADKNDPIVPLVLQMISNYPEIDAQLIVGDVTIGANPKINNMIKGYESAKNDWILISDSNVRVNRDYLKRLMAHVENDTGIITAVVVGKFAKSYGGQLEAMYLNTFYSKWILLSQIIGEPIVIGKSMLFKKTIAERFGGIKTLSCYLAEDYMAGKAMQQLGYKTITMVDPIIQPIGKYDFSSFWSRHIRWGRIRKAQAPLAFYFEPFVCSLPSAIIGGISFIMLFGSIGVYYPIFHLSIWGIFDLILHLRLSNESISLYRVWIWVTRESLHMPLWIQTLFGNSILWRGNKMKLLRGGLLESSWNQ